MHRNIRLTVSYDGTNYVGWQVQPNGISVQSVVGEAIRRLTGDEVNLIGASRTDSGVHALGQVANFRTESSIPCEKMRAGLQHFMPSDVAVRAVEDVADDFHATYSATRKRYRYLIDNTRVPDPFLEKYAWRISTPLDVDAMHAAAQALVGTHDFRSFESQWPNKATSVRTVLEATVGRCAGWNVWTQPGALAKTGAGDERFVYFEIAADGFLYNMVRAIMGTLVKVGIGSWPVGDVRRILEAQDRSQAGETAPPHGLYLVQVTY